MSSRITATLRLCVDAMSSIPIWRSHGRDVGMGAVTGGTWAWAQSRTGHGRSHGQEVGAVTGGRIWAQSRAGGGHERSHGHHVGMGAVTGRGYGRSHRRDDVGMSAVLRCRAGRQRYMRGDLIWGISYVVGFLICTPNTGHH